MKLRFTQPALADLEEVLDFIAARSPGGAIKVQARLKAVMELLLRHPGIGAQTDDSTVRRIVASPYPYLVFYEVTGDEIIIHAVRHGARNPASMPGAD